MKLHLLFSCFLTCLMAAERSEKVIGGVGPLVFRRYTAASRVGEWFGVARLTASRYRYVSSREGRVSGQNPHGRGFPRRRTQVD